MNVSMSLTLIVRSYKAMFRAPDLTQLCRVSFSRDPVFVGPHDVNTNTMYHLLNY